jgi:hypothetical protein
MIVSANQPSKESKPLSHDTLKLSDAKVLTEAREVLKERLPLEAAGYVCTADNLYDALLGVASNRGTSRASPGSCDVRWRNTMLRSARLWLSLLHAYEFWIY